MTMRDLLNTSRSPVSVERGGNPIVTFQDEVNRLFGEFFGEPSVSVWRRPATAQNAVLSPALDVSETPQGYKIAAELPGLDVKDVQITASEGYLVIKGEKKAVAKEEKEGYFRQERSYGAFQRVVALPEIADLDNADAKMDKGVLTVSIPKKAEAKPKERTIEIKHAA
ncbi:MAG TPA: Hsp20/alpha crystallin family protein [Rickettsiales bacterium]|nr:Hsp20/alpha crystallin family protein [Rickettsiales bacterium]